MQRSWFDLEGRVALVTGASRGLGRTMALALARAGADVVVVARTEPALHEVAHEIQALGRRALPVVVDVTAEDDVRRMVRESVATFGRLDILVNNAGVGESRSLVEMEASEWDRTMAVNVRGPMLCCKHVGPVMIEQRRGKIINVASVLATRVARYMSLYCASKAALVQFTRALALEWVRYNIQINALCPGYFLTDINRDFFASERGQQFIRELPMKRLGEAQELEGAVVFLASDATSYITGTCLYVDGGHSLL
ncbi:MAG: SDR family oxidoreductase [Candidatus Binatia bacterium]|nr:SDR family oxidoreductase [Candidatus Binatia bacterium]